jgi:hypothetical protein
MHLTTSNVYCSFLYGAIALNVGPGYSQAIEVKLRKTMPTFQTRQPTDLDPFSQPVTFAHLE